MQTKGDHFVTTKLLGMNFSKVVLVISLLIIVRYYGKCADKHEIFEREQFSVEEYETPKEVATAAIPSKKAQIDYGNQVSLFDDLMQHLQSLQSNISSSYNVIIYKPNAESGLGNVVIGLISCIIAALSTNRGINMIFFPLYNDIFYPAITSLTYKDGSIPPKEMGFFFMYNAMAQGRAIRNNNLNDLVKKRAILVDCFTNVTSHFLTNYRYSSVLEQHHIWYKKFPQIVGVTNLLYELALYPKQPVCGVVSKYLELMKDRVMIGVQVRIGGKKKYYEDKQFLFLDDVQLFVDAIDNYMSKNQLALTQVFIFISTDDASVVSQFQSRYGDSLVFVKEFEIGHSAPNKNLFEKTKSIEHAKRAATDLLILKSSDFLLITKDSSFGELSSILQGNRNSDVILDKYIVRSKNDSKCNIFKRTNRLFSSMIIGSTSMM